MNQLLALWRTLTPRRRLLVGAATLAVVAAVLGMARLSASRDMVLLYSGLDASSSGEIIKALDAQGAPYEVRGNAIFVDRVRRDLLRMSLAGDGLPSSSADGYELLDNLSGFGTTSQMFDAAYWRAKEGELARTILANPEIRAARVHLSTVSSRPFDRSFEPSASVAITTTGNGLDSAGARALRFLVASAVAGLKPEKVAVIDSRTGVVLGAEARPAAEASEKAAELRSHVLRLLEARVGAGKAIVEVTVDIATETESIIERQIDPGSRVQISNETEERTSTSRDSGGGEVTVASNLPSRGDADGSTSNSQDSSTRERVNFDVSETRREVHRAPGDIRRLTVAVLVDGIRSLDAAGVEQWTPRSEAELADLHDLVASAVGYSESRADSITIRSLEFDPPRELGTLAESGEGGSPIDVQALIELGALALVALVLGLFVLRPALLARAVPGAASAGIAPATLSYATAPGLPAAEAPDSGIPEEGFAINNNFLPAAPVFGDGGEDTGYERSDPVARLRRLVADRREESVEVLRTWMEEAR